MAKLMDDLLALARVTRTELVRVDVDLSALAHRIAVDLKATAPDRRGELIIEEGMHGTETGVCWESCCRIS